MLDEVIKEYGGLILGGLGVILVLAGFIAALKFGVGDIIANFLTAIL